MRTVVVLLGLWGSMLMMPQVSADPGPSIGGNVDVTADIGGPGSGIVLILCPGAGGGMNVFGAGGGWCDYDFQKSGAHTHCEWGGFGFVAGGWQCWRVWKGQPDHPRLPDPDIVPDGSPPRPGALRGPSPEDQAPEGQSSYPEVPFGLAP